MLEGVDETEGKSCAELLELQVLCENDIHASPKNPSKSGGLCSCGVLVYAM